MNLTLALKTLDRVMGWDQERCRQEFAWLSLMARFKYDSYRGYSAGSRFIESLIYWLQQFKQDEREDAYQFVRSSLIYVGPQEMGHLVTLAYPEVVQRHLVAQLAVDLSVPYHRVWRHPKADASYRRLLRQCLFMGLSDGARMDAFRRSNEELISNEQVCVATEVNYKKWASLRGKLCSDTKDDCARFRVVMLIDDFTGSGTTLLRKEADGWDGKLFKFFTQVKPEMEKGTFAEPLSLLVHHYVATKQAVQAAESRSAQASREIEGWFKSLAFTWGTVLPENIQIRPERHAEFCRLIEEYYDASVETESIRKGGESAKYGFSSGRLPLVLEHNTPNNSVALLWAETQGKEGPPMRPLFRRRQRHF